MILRILGLSTALLLALSSSIANAHGSHSNEVYGDPNDWVTRHMREEHHIDRFDAASFFALHDFDNSGDWTYDEVWKTLGLHDESTKDVKPEDKQLAVREVFGLFDPGKTGSIKRDEWIRLYDQGRRIRDFGFGPGHHGDMEYEYEIHHFEKYHGDDATEEELTHPEDIEHFKRHDEEELAAERLEQLERMQIVVGNIPAKFRRNA